MATLEVDMEGVDAVIEALEDISGNYRTKVKKILMQAGELLLDHILQKVETNVYDVPRKDGRKKNVTGALRQEWDVYVQGFINTKVGLLASDDPYAVIVGTALHYAPHLEYGTTNDEDKQLIEPRKFVEEAWLEHKDEVLAFISRKTKELTDLGG